MTRTLPAYRGWLRVEFFYRPRDPVELIHYEEDAADFDTYVRYTDREVADGTFAATPSMVVKFPRYTGALNEDLLELDLPRDSFTAAISGSDPFPRPIRCTVEEHGPDGRIAQLFVGHVQRAIRNYSGRKNRVRVDVRNLKGGFDYPLGIPATPTCAWTFMGLGCAEEVPGGDALEQVARSVADPVLLPQFKAGEGEVLSISDKIVGIDVDVVPVESFQARRYQRGFVVLNGVRIGIREWVSSDPTVFHTLEKVPSEWLGETVVVFPGCDKLHSTCNQRWNNAKNFGGFGLGIPARHPNFEQ